MIKLRWVLVLSLLVVGLSACGSQKSGEQATVQASVSPAVTAEVPAATPPAETATPVPSASKQPAATPTATPAARPQSTPAESQPLPGYRDSRVICIDPGHQKQPDQSTEEQSPGSGIFKIKDPGGTAGVVTGIPEHVHALAVSVYLRDELEKNGWTVVMTRTTADVRLGNIARAEIANKAGAALFVRIHADGAEDASVRGISVLVPAATAGGKNRADISAKYASAMIKALCEDTGAKNRGVVTRDDLTGFNWAQMPSVLVETGFMSNAEEDRTLSQDSYRRKLAAAMARGIGKPSQDHRN